MFSAAWDFSRMRREDVHLTQFWSILTKQSLVVHGYVCVGRPQGGGLISSPLIGHLDPVKASHWLLMTGGQTVTADDPII